ncbi:MAG: YdiU family protein, partial [Bdellovibrionaceae bacterium]|nr:YdiU family protein [Pseudobdellovibrionaceae bacterium]
IDYGPCAFMDRYSLATVFSSIDRQGRYAYGQQITIAHWNLSRLAEALVPLFSENEDESIAKAEETLNTFAGHVQQKWLSGMRRKLGLVTAEENDMSLTTSLLQLMEKNQTDYTNTFRALSNEKTLDQPLFKDADFLKWRKLWLAKKPDFALMQTHNPAVIPRNHLVEKALAAAVEKDDYSVIERLLAVLKNPYSEPVDATEYASPPPEGGEAYKTFCGT